MKLRLVVLLLLLALPGVAAHAEPFQSDPAGGSRLDEAPQQVRVAFTEPMFRDGSWIRVLDAQGQRVDNDDLMVQGEQRPVMTLSLQSGLPDGAYRIAWQTYSETDGHTVRGSIGFAVGGFTPPEDEVQQEAAFDAWPSLARTLLYTGFALAIGAFAFAWTMRLPTQPRFLQIGAVAALTGTLLLLWDTWQGTGLPLSEYLTSDGGRRMSLRVLVLAGISVLTVLWTIVRPGLRSAMPVLASAWLVVAYQSAQWGHITQQGSWGVWLELAHLLAAATWIGGLAAFFVHLGSNPIDWRSAGKRFGALAAACVAVLAASGLALALLLVQAAWRGDASQVWQDSWAWFLALKLAAVAVMLGAAAINRYGYLAKAPPVWLTRWLPADGPDGMRRIVRWEAGMAVVALLAAGMLLSVSPPQFVAPGPPALERTAQGEVFTGVLEVSPAPSVGTIHTFRFFVNDSQQNEPVWNNTCGRDDCIKARWVIDGDEGTQQEAAAVPEGDGWWRVDSVLFTQAGIAVIELDVQTGYVYLDTLRFESFPVS